MHPREGVACAEKLAEIEKSQTEIRAEMATVSSKASTAASQFSESTGGPCPVEQRSEFVMGFLGVKLKAAQCEKTATDVLTEAGVLQKTYTVISAVRDEGRLATVH